MNIRDTLESEPSYSTVNYIVSIPTNRELYSSAAASVRTPLSPQSFSIVTQRSTRNARSHLVRMYVLCIEPL